MRINKLVTGVVTLGLVICSVGEAQSKVEILKTPNDGVQPKVRVDQSGQVHLLYFKGSPEAGDLFYVKKSRDGKFADPIKVNSISGSAVSVGTIRGAQFTLGANNTIHVVWNGSMKTRSDSNSAPAMYYSRINENGKEFVPQRVISEKWHVDGGGAIAADKRGNVYVFWHSATEGSEEKDRQVFIRISNDNGENFGKERVINPKGTGVCGCCAMQAEIDSEGNLYVVYRTAKNNKNRDIGFLVSKDSGKAFQDNILDRWQVMTCPMSSMSFGEINRGMLVGWETENEVRIAPVAKGTVKSGKLISPSNNQMGSKHPVFAVSPKGNVLISWTEGTGWKKGGSIAWREYDATLRPISEVGRLPAGVSVWSFVASYYDQNDGVFYILH